mgnify:CR=1 FL=1
MLPGLTTPACLRRPLASCCALLLSLLMACGLAGCSAVGQPPQRVLLSALARQIDLTQRSIANSLTLEAGGEPLVSRVRVESQQAIPIGGSKGLHLTGRFDWRLPGDPIRVDSAFDLYLQRGERGQSWRLARPSGSSDGSTQDWIIDPLPIA